MNKTYLSMVGASTVGKSTLAKVLLQAGDPNMVVAVPQTTRRPRRPDDVEQLLRVLPSQEFDTQDYFIKHGYYGILSRDFAAFCAAPQPLGYSVSGPRELMQIPQAIRLNSAEITRLNLMIRFSHDRDEHRHALGLGLKRHFDAAVANERLAIYDELDDNFYFNDTFIAEHIDMILTRQSTLAEWVGALEQRMGIKLVKGMVADQILERRGAFE